MLGTLGALAIFSAAALPLIDAAPLAGWPRAQEPQTTDLVEDASRAEREERCTPS